MAAAHRKVIDTEHGHLAGIGVRQRPDQAQQRATPHRQPKPAGQPCPGAAGQRQLDLLQQPAGQWAPASIRGGQAGDLLGEGAGRAGWVVAVFGRR
jgi:anti-sigma factor RsiW